MANPEFSNIITQQPITRLIISKTITAFTCMQCNATVSLRKFFDMVYEEPKKMLLYGDACRVSTDPIAKASYFFDLIQVSLQRSRRPRLWLAILGQQACKFKTNSNVSHRNAVCVASNTETRLMRRKCCFILGSSRIIGFHQQESNLDESRNCTKVLVGLLIP